MKSPSVAPRAVRNVLIFCASPPTSRLALLLPKTSTLVPHAEACNPTLAFGA